MKKLIALIATTCLALSLVIVGVAYSSTSDDFNPEAGKKNTSTTSGVLNVPQYGRFICEDVGINVGMYNSNLQAVCDAKDSACFYQNKGYSGMVLADHASQDFKKLLNVSVGTTAEIVTLDGGSIQLICNEVFDGHNTKTTITDSNYNTVLGLYDITTYTCLNNAQNVRVCQWSIVNTKDFSSKYNKQFSIDNSFSKKCVSFTCKSKHTH